MASAAASKLNIGGFKSEISIDSSLNMSIARRCITARHVMQDRATARNFRLDPTNVKHGESGRSHLRGSFSLTFGRVKSEIPRTSGIQRRHDAEHGGRHRPTPVAEGGCELGKKHLFSPRNSTPELHPGTHTCGGGDVAWSPGFAPRKNGAPPFR